MYSAQRSGTINVEELVAQGNYFMKYGTLNYPAALECFKKAALQGKNAEAYDKLGFLHEQGLAVAKDARKAIEYYQIAGNLGNANACRRLGYIYKKGKKAPRSLAKSAEWYQKGANLGDPNAYYELGEMYRSGEGVTKNYQKAAEYIQQAIERGYGNEYTIRNPSLRESMQKSAQTTLRDILKEAQQEQEALVRERRQAEERRQDEARRELKEQRLAEERRQVQERYQAEERRRFEEKRREEELLRLEQERKLKLQAREEEELDHFAQALSKLQLNCSTNDKKEASRINAEFKKLEPEAVKLKSAGFYLMRAQFFDQSAQAETTGTRKQLLQDSALKDYRQALAYDPFVEDAAERIEAIEAEKRSALNSAPFVPASSFKPASAPAYPSTSSPLTPEQRAKVEALKQQMAENPYYPPPMHSVPATPSFSSTQRLNLDVLKPPLAGKQPPLPNTPSPAAPPQLTAEQRAKIEALKAQMLQERQKEKPQPLTLPVPTIVTVRPRQASLPPQPKPSDLVEDVMPKTLSDKGRERSQSSMNLPNPIPRALPKGAPPPQLPARPKSSKAPPVDAVKPSQPSVSLPNIAPKPQPPAPEHSSQVQALKAKLFTPPQAKVAPGFFSKTADSALNRERRASVAQLQANLLQSNVPLLGKKLTD